jgi:transposase
MLVKLHTLISAILPPTRGIRLLEVFVGDELVRLQLTVRAPTAACPRCAVASSSVHSRYQRHLTDLPWGTRAVRIQLTVRKFRCRNRACAKLVIITFTPVGSDAGSPGRHHLKQQQLRSLNYTWPSRPRRPCAIHDCGVLGRQRHESTLWRRKARVVEDALTDLFHVPIPPVVAAVVFRQDHVVEGGPQLLARHPQQHLRVG